MVVTSDFNDSLQGLIFTQELFVDKYLPKRRNSYKQASLIAQAPSWEPVKSKSYIG